MASVSLMAASVLGHSVRGACSSLVSACMAGSSLTLPSPPFAQVEFTQTARFKDGSTDLLKAMDPLSMQAMPRPSGKALAIDWTTTYQEIVGFGGAFTEAAAVNWRALSDADRSEMIRLYFADPSEGGHGYTLGRVPINSCDFSPGSYNFDNVTGDTELEQFDTTVQHDVDSGIIGMIQAAQDAINKRGRKLRLYASPWSPPAWMKTPVDGAQSMTLSAKPNGLMASMQRTWANYFSKFITAYKSHGIDIWGVTVQNEPEAAVGWEACLWTPQYQADFVKNHLGPVLNAEQPGVKIIGFDHNKDHVLLWAKGLYADPEARKYFDGVGVHWYGGLNLRNLNATHHLAPDKFILATEACNCGGVVYREPSIVEWWARAESLALDILEDLRFWAVGWTDWNLILSTLGGPNHLKNLCDANIIADPTNSLKTGTLIMQASYYFMGHFSRFIPAGSKRIALDNSVETHAPPLSPDDVKNGQAMIFAPCNGNDVQKWKLDSTGSFSVRGTDRAVASDGYKHGGECLDVDLTSSVRKLQTWSCAHSPNQLWSAVSIPGGGSKVVNQGTGACMTAVQTSGDAVGLDKGVKVTAAEYSPCIAGGAPNQTFHLNNYDGQGFPANFPVRTDDGLCLQPQITRTPHFDAVAFITPDDHVSLVAMNLGEAAVEFDLYDEQLGIGAQKVTIPPHAIHSYRWTTHDNYEQEGGADGEHAAMLEARLVDEELLLLGEKEETQKGQATVERPATVEMPATIERPATTTPQKLRPIQMVSVEPRAGETSSAVGSLSAVALTALVVVVAAALVAARSTLTRALCTSPIIEQEMREPLRDADHFEYRRYE